VGARSRSGKDRNNAKITRRAGYGGVFTLMGREHPSCCDSSQNPRRGQQEAEDGERQASRMRHALPVEEIHLHIYYAPTRGTLGSAGG